MSGTYDPALFINHVMHWLMEQGCQPQISAKRVEAAEQAAQTLLRCMEVEPVHMARLMTPVRVAPINYDHLI